MNIPLLDLKREYRFLKKEIDANIKKCLKGQQWVLGPAVSEFEQRCAKYLGVPYTIGVASGTDALLLSLHAFAITGARRKTAERCERSAVQML